MKQAFVVVGTLVGMLGVTPPAFSQASGTTAGAPLGTVTLNRPVLADGKPLAAGTYIVRLGRDEVKPAVGQSPDAAQVVEFVRGGKVVGREVATVILAADMGGIAGGSRPVPGSAKVELLKGNDYLRVWINRAGTNYLIHLPTS